MAAAAVKISVQTDWNGLLSSFDVAGNASMQTLWGKLNEVYPNLTNGPPLRLTYVNRADGEVELHSPGDLAAALAQSKSSRMLELFISNASNGGTEETSTDGSSTTMKAGQNSKQRRPRPRGSAFWTCDTTWLLESDNVSSEDRVSEARPSTRASVNFDCVLKQTGGGPAENWEDGQGHKFLVFLTRALGTEYPYLEFSNDNEPFTLHSLRFQHDHNHNPGYSTCRTYSVQLQLDRGEGDGFLNIGRPLLLYAENSGSISTIDLGGVLITPRQNNQQLARLRWIATGLAYGNDTQSEFFSLRQITLRITPKFNEAPSRAENVSNPGGEGQANNGAAAPGGPRTEIEGEEGQEEGRAPGSA